MLFRDKSEVLQHTGNRGLWGSGWKKARWLCSPCMVSFCGINGLFSSAILSKLLHLTKCIDELRECLINCIDINNVTGNLFLLCDRNLIIRQVFSPWIGFTWRTRRAGRTNPFILPVSNIWCIAWNLQRLNKRHKSDTETLQQNLQTNVDLPLDNWIWTTAPLYLTVLILYYGFSCVCWLHPFCTVWGILCIFAIIHPQAP